jgi:hypothetical protein
MTVVGWHQNDYYLPEDGILVVRDAGVGFSDDEMSATDAHPVGTIVRTGQGWLYSGGGDGPCVVRLQFHSDRPADSEDWDDLVEAPYGSRSGVVGLSGLTSPSGEKHLQLGEPGPYRVRVAHRPLPQPIGPVPEMDDEEAEENRAPTDLWQLDFWSVTGPVEPPRWIRRRVSAVRPTNPGWGRLLGFRAEEIPNVVIWAGRADGLTAGDLQQWGVDHYRGENWLDQPLAGSHTLRGHPTLAEIAGQVGVPEPTTRREVLPLAVALGVLTFDGNRYVGVEHPPLAQEVLQLPAEVVDFLEAYQANIQFTGFAADLVSIALWGGSEQTVESLAERTLASEADVRAALRYAERYGVARVDHLSADRFTLAPLKRKPR